jgi:hypothetical protein
MGPRDRCAAAEGKRETDHPVDDRADREVDQDLCDPGSRVLHSRETDLEQQEAGLHEHHQHSGDDHPHRVEARDRVVERRAVLARCRDRGQQQQGGGGPDAYLRKLPTHTRLPP